MRKFYKKLLCIYLLITNINITSQKYVTIKLLPKHHKSRLFLSSFCEFLFSKIKLNLTHWFTLLNFINTNDS